MLLQNHTCDVITEWFVIVMCDKKQGVYRVRVVYEACRTFPKRVSRENTSVGSFGSYATAATIRVRRAHADDACARACVQECMTAGWNEGQGDEKQHGGKKEGKRTD